MLIRIVDKGTEGILTPNLDKLVERPEALGYYEFIAMERNKDKNNMDDMRHVEKTTKRFHHFIAHYVVAAFGYTKMMALLKENKGKSVWNFLSIDNLVNSIFIIKNQQASWTRAYNVNIMDREEKQKYASYKTLDTPEDRIKYAPIEPKFKRKTKREFGKSLVSTEGHNFYSRTKKNWQLCSNTEPSCIVVLCTSSILPPAKHQ